MKKLTDLTAYDGLPDKTLLSTRDIFEQIGVDRSHVSRYLKAGLLPPSEEDFITGGQKNIQGGRRASKYWKLGTLRKFIKESK